MRVRIVSGNSSGQIVDLPQAEAEAALATGFAERAPEPVAPATAAEPAPAPPPAPEPPAFEESDEPVTEEVPVDAPKPKRRGK